MTTTKKKSMTKKTESIIMENDMSNNDKNVIPSMECKQCGKMAGDDYRPRKTKYAAHEVV